MRVFALSDVHVDYAENAQWVAQLSDLDFTEDILVLAGDVSDRVSRIAACLDHLVRKFRCVFFVPGNHELWVKKSERINSIEKFYQVQALAASCGAKIHTEEVSNVVFVPLLSWYDFSFGKPSDFIRRAWVDFSRCVWPESMRELADVAGFFHNKNIEALGRATELSTRSTGVKVVTFSHFLPRIDVMPDGIPPSKRDIYPVLGSGDLDAQVRAAGADIHIYGHSHVNRCVAIDEIWYVNNAYAYPKEKHLARKSLFDVLECVSLANSK